MKVEQIMPRVLKVGLTAGWLFSSSAAQGTTGVMTSEDSVSTYFQLTEALFPEWVASFRVIEPDFGADVFTMRYDRAYWDCPRSWSFEFGKGMSARDSVYFEFSPDSLRVVDINAFAEVVNTERGRRIGFDADAAVVVGDVTIGHFYYLDVGGPQTGFLEARWVDNDRILIVGHDYVDHFPKCIPFFKLYDLKERVTVGFRSTKPYACARRPYTTNVDSRMERMKISR